MPMAFQRYEASQHHEAAIRSRRLFGEFRSPDPNRSKTAAGGRGSSAESRFSKTFASCLPTGPGQRNQEMAQALEYVSSGSAQPLIRVENVNVAFHLAAGSEENRDRRSWPLGTISKAGSGGQ